MRDGLLLVDKAAGSTSHDVVQACRRILGQKKIGHCGTLDPAATGLLLLTCGKATRLTRFLIRAPKVYEGTIRFGIETDTYDASGAVVSEGDIRTLDQETIDREMRRFEGDYEQTPPAYSAKKVRGERYFKLAREGREVPRTTSVVQVFEFARTAPLAEGRIPFRLGCSSGTYARTLAHDLGQRLGPGAHLEGLRRLQIGGFELGSAVTLDRLRELAEGDGDLHQGWVDFDDIDLPFEAVAVDLQQEGRFANGQTVISRELAAAPGDWVKIESRRGRFIGVGTVREQIGDGPVRVIQPRIVFH